MLQYLLEYLSRGLVIREMSYLKWHASALGMLRFIVIMEYLRIPEERKGRTVVLHVQYLP
jgi:hypothetical protein